MITYKIGFVSSQYSSTYLQIKCKPLTLCVLQNVDVSFKRNFDDGITLINIAEIMAENTPKRIDLHLRFLFDKLKLKKCYEFYSPVL